MSTISEFFGELRRRKVFRVAIVYGVVAWLVVEIASVVLPGLLLPDWTLRLVIVLAIFGFPIAITLAWVFDITPVGLERTGPAAVAEDPKKVEEVEATAPRVAAPENSIAVLPFANIGGDKENEYFCDGLAEDLLIVLSRARGLRVAARSSAFAFRDSHQDVRSIGEQLGVATMLEGSVRRSGDRLRVTVRLVNVADGYQLWSDTYDRELGDIFAIQDEISRSVYEALSGRLIPGAEQPSVRPATHNVEAYDLYLLGRHRFHKRTEDSLLSAVECFQRAIDLDENFALPYTGLSDAYVLLANTTTGYGNMPVPEAIEHAEPMVQKALALDPDLAEAHASLGFLLRLYGRLSESEASLRRALELNPDYPMAHVWLGLTLGDQGRLKEALEEHEFAFQSDPLSNIVNANLGYDYLKFGRYDDARTKFRRVMDLNPDFPVAYSGMAQLERDLGNLSEALKWAKRASQISTTRSFYHCLISTLLLEAGDVAAAERELAIAETGCPDDPAVIRQRVALHIVRGDYDSLKRYTEQRLAADAPDVEACANAGLAHLLADNIEVAHRYYRLGNSDYSNSLNDAVVWSWRFPHALLFVKVLLESGESERARALLADHAKRLEELRQEEIVSSEIDYLQASIFCLEGKQQDAMAALERAVQLGLQARWWALRDPNLQMLRDSGQFEQILKSKS